VLPPNRSEAELASYVVDEHRAAWLAWRADALTALYGRLQSVAANGRENRRLYLVGAHGWDRPDVEARVRPSLPQTSSAELALLESGRRSRQARASAGRGLDAAIKRPPRNRRQFAAQRPKSIGRERSMPRPEHAEPAGLLFHESQSSRLASFDTKPVSTVAMRIVSTSRGGVGRSPKRSCINSLRSTQSPSPKEAGSCRSARKTS
jgi:hypothetical protein